MIESPRPLEPVVRASRRNGSATRIAVVLAVALAAIVAATAVLGAPPPTRIDAMAGASASPAADRSAKPKRDKPKAHGQGHGFRGLAGFHRGQGLGRDIRITAIAGTRISLETVDGWTRTIEAGPDTKIHKNGTEATVGDLAVGDQVSLRQRRNDDGSFTVTALVVPQPMLGGVVSAVTSSRITVTQRDGSSATIHVGSDTTFKARRGAQVGLGDVKVGDVVIAVGTLRADGSLDATGVHVGGTGKIKERGERGPKRSLEPTPAS
jgi:hypothetical protein